MKLKKAKLDNFGSYEHLEFDFSTPGLSLVQGATGSGKSTLFDAPTWILYGITAKDGSVDDVRGWNDLSSPTIGTLELEVRGLTLRVTRVRGKPNENDLYFTKEENETQHRGTNIKETQTLLNLMLGSDSDTYLAASYFSEYGPASSFFLNNAKQRRQLLDKIAHLDFPVMLDELLSDKISRVKKDLVKSQNDIASLTRQFNLSMSNLKDSTMRLETWESKFLNKVEELQDKSLNFEKHRTQELTLFIHEYDLFEAVRQATVEDFKVNMAQATATTKICPTCKSVIQVDITNLLQKELDRVVHMTNPHSYSVEEGQSRVNTAQDQLKEHLKQINPFKGQREHFSQQADEISKNLGAEQFVNKDFTDKQVSYEQLRDFALVLKERLLEDSVDSIEISTNRYLETYFDGELNISLILVNSDSIDLQIFKNGHEAVYKQLSKGQRQLLKLSFSIAIMRAVASRSGIHFNSLFFDEALDGLDINLKVKAFSLFSSMEIDHGSIFVIDHAEEFKNLFNQRYLVTIASDRSTIIDAEHSDDGT